MGADKLEIKTRNWELLVCLNRRLTPASVSCAGRGSERLAAKATELLKAAELPVELRPVYCFGRCGKGPNFRLSPGERFFDRVEDGDLEGMIEQIASIIADYAPDS